MENLVQVPLVSLIPFVVMLLMIAIAPLLLPEKWESNKVKLLATLVIAVPTAIYLVFLGLGESLAHQLMFDYVPFIMLLLALYVVTGGIKINGDLPATPAVNTAMLALGFVLASFMGTTGAAMLMIRPLLEINKQRTRKTHTVLFLIALVANCGGVLTPLGDPPLFLLYLKGAPFEWFLHLVPMWSFVGIVLLIVYYFFDRYHYSREPMAAIKKDKRERKEISIKGGINFVYLLAIIASVLFINVSFIPAMAAEDSPLFVKYLRELAFLIIILLSVFTTSKAVRTENRFSWAPILEVAILFVGIFTTMTPALLYLKTNAESMGLTQAWQFFYCTGFLSAFLDNAPTAVAFHSLAEGLTDPATAGLVAGIPEILLEAIALGAVFFGSMTYIGNGPNFMVKAIAESDGIKMPSFFGYMYKFSLIILLPVYIIVQLIAFL